MNVGDIVICHGWGPTENKKGFIEDINKFGQYSIYGFEEINVKVGSKLFYGEYFKENLESYHGLKLDKQKLEIHLNEFVRPKNKIKKINDEYELFVFNGSCKISDSMDKPDPNFPPNTIIQRGSEAIRQYWNNKNLRKRKKIEVKN